MASALFLSRAKDYAYITISTPHLMLRRAFLPNVNNAHYKPNRRNDNDASMKPMHDYKPSSIDDDLKQTLRRGRSKGDWRLSFVMTGCVIDVVVFAKDHVHLSTFR